MQMTDTPEEVAIRNPPRITPRFAGFKCDETKYIIFVDSRVVTDTPFFSRALTLCFALFYVLNLEYRKPLKEVCLFLQEFVFHCLLLVHVRSQSHTYLSPLIFKSFLT